MSTYKHMERICAVLIVLILAGSLVLFSLRDPLAQTVFAQLDYTSSLFDTDKVHTIDITMDDWEGFLKTCEDEEYTMCTAVIDGEAYQNIAIRAKGNTSLSSVKSYGNNRYSFKIEFDHYQDNNTYDGLDKLILNNMIQDNTYMKDYLTYQMMGAFGVDTPLCSFAYLTVNGEDWGLYLAVEGVEDSFLDRNYGGGQGELYKPDNMSMGGDQGKERPEGGGPDGGKPPQIPNGVSGEAAQTNAESGKDSTETTAPGQDPMTEQTGGEGIQPEEAAGADRNDQTKAQDTLPPQLGADTETGTWPQPGEGGPDFGGPGGMMDSDDVSLRYTDDDVDHYNNIFDNAKTEVTEKDKARLIASLKTLNEGEAIESVVDTEEVLRYFVVHNFVCNFDSYTGSIIHNYYLYEENGILSMIPWDYNLAFGGFMGSQDATSLVNYPIDTPVSGNSIEDRPMLAWIFADETYTEQYHTYFSQFIASYFESGSFETEFNRVVDMIAPYVEKDPTKFCTYEEFQTGTATLQRFCQLRAQSVRGQLDGTIPSTEEGQQAENTALVDASTLTISDMGSMGAGMGGGMELPDFAADGWQAQKSAEKGDHGGEINASGSPPAD